MPLGYVTYQDHDSSGYFMLIFWFILAALFGTALYFGFRVTPEQLASCMEVTGWTAERCEWELHR